MLALPLLPKQNKTHPANFEWNLASTAHVTWHWEVHGTVLTLCIHLGLILPVSSSINIWIVFLRTTGYIYTTLYIIENVSVLLWFEPAAEEVS